MCKPASFVVTKDRVFWSQFSDSHEDIIHEHKLHEGRGRINFVRVKIVPKCGDMQKPLKQWVFEVDQPDVPKWFDRANVEKRVRLELKKWFKSKVVLRGKRDIKGEQVYVYGSSQVWACDSSRVEAYGSSQVYVYDSSQVRAYDSSRVEACGSSRVEACGSSRVEAYDSSRVEAYDSSRVEACDSSRVEAYDSSRVEACGSSRVEAYGSSRVEAYEVSVVNKFSSLVSVTLKDDAVEIDRSGKRPKCKVAPLRGK